MRKVFTASAFALFGLMVARANAMPFPPLSHGLSGVTPVAFGCGPGWTRGPYGGCQEVAILSAAMARRVCMGPTVLTAITHTPMPMAITHTPTDTATIAATSGARLKAPRRARCDQRAAQYHQGPEAIAHAILFPPEKGRERQETLPKSGEFRRRKEDLGRLGLSGPRRQKVCANPSRKGPRRLPAQPGVRDNRRPGSIPT
jgi:hypothetical protein